MTYAERLDHVCQNRVYPKKVKPIAKARAAKLKSKEIIDSSEEEEEIIESSEDEEEHGDAGSSDSESLHLAVSEQSSDEDSIVPVPKESEVIETSLPQTRVRPKSGKSKSKEIIDSSEEKEEIKDSSKETEEECDANSSYGESVHLEVREQNNEYLGAPVESHDIETSEIGDDEAIMPGTQTFLESSFDLYRPPTTIIDRNNHDDAFEQGPSNNMLTTDLDPLLSSDATGTILNEWLPDISLGQTNHHQVTDEFYAGPDLPNEQSVAGVSDILEQTRRELDSLNE